jgi:hypothetical protein
MTGFNKFKGVFLGGPANGQRVPEEAFDGRSQYLVEVYNETDDGTFTTIAYVRKVFMFENKQWIMFVYPDLTDQDVMSLATQWLDSAAT